MMPSTSANVSVHLNPRFKNAHINPKFMQTQSTKIYINPNFLSASNPSPPVPVLQAVPLVNTRRKLVRNVTKAAPSTQGVAPKESLPSFQSAPPRTKVSKFKVDRRAPTRSTTVEQFNKVIVSKYRLRKMATDGNLTPKRTAEVSKFRLRRIGTTPGQYPTTTKTFQSSRLLNINGVFYRASARKLHKSTIPAKTPSMASPTNRTIFIRGEAFTVAGSGNSLQRLPHKAATPPSTTLKRIDIGGITYRRNEQGTLERTNSHFIRNYLSQAKQKSITILSRTAYKKNNIPCMIYRRVGKCLAQERGRCNKVHDPNQVAVCRKFLKGMCTNQLCLLSHKTSLNKMPTCRFYLEGCCTTINCPYLHKKVSQNTEICSEFAKGFCPLAEKCPNRHETKAPKRTGKELYKLNSRPPLKRARIEENVPCVKKETSESRYYKAKDEEPLRLDPSDAQSVHIVPRRPPIGSLPAFIPL